MMSLRESEDRVAAIKQTTPLSSVVGETLSLKRCGREAKTNCPFHADSDPSFYVNDEKGTYHCFGCGASGDVITFVQEMEGLSFPEALDRLEEGYSPSYRPAPPPLRCPHGPEHNIARAKRIWKEGIPIEDTPAELYLAKRSLPLANLPDLYNLRFCRIPYPGSPELHPALIAAVRTADWQFAGIQRTYLTEDGNKLNVQKAKLSLGSVKGNAIRIDEVGWPDDECIYVCEGLEDGLSLSRMHGLPVWVSAGAGMMRWMQLPRRCKHVTICPDNDDSGAQAAEVAASAFRARGVETEIMELPAEFKDANEFLQFWDVRDHEQKNDPDFRWRRG